MKRQRHTREYKLEAVRLAKNTEKSTATVAAELGIPTESLYIDGSASSLRKATTLFVATV